MPIEYQTRDSRARRTPALWVPPMQRLWPRTMLASPMLPGGRNGPPISSSSTSNHVPRASRSLQGAKAILLVNLAVPILLVAVLDDDNGGEEDHEVECCREESVPFRCWQGHRHVPAPPNMAVKTMSRKELANALNGVTQPPSLSATCRLEQVWSVMNCGLTGLR